MSEHDEGLEPHLNHEDIRRYAIGTLDSVGALLAVEAHLDRCVRCRALLYQQTAGGGVTLARAFSTASDPLRLPCPDAALLARYVEERADAADVELVAAHLEGCAPCREAEHRERAGWQRSLKRTVAPPEWRNALAAMLNGSFVWPSLDALQPGFQRGEANAAPASIALLRPVQTVVRLEQPLLECVLPYGARDSQAFVYDVSTYQGVEVAALSEAAWQPCAPLARGGIYEWYVIAHHAGETLSSPVVRFQVADAQTAADLAPLPDRYKADALEAGVLYARAGLFEEAIAELTQWQQERPTDEDAPALLRVIAQVRQIT